MYKLWEYKKVRYFIAPMLIIAAICFCVLYGLSGIPIQKIDFNKEITTIKSDDLNTINQSNTDYDTNDTVTVTGTVYNPWFSDGFFVGNIDFENNSELSRELTLPTSNVKIGSILYDVILDGYIYDTPQPTYIIEYISESDATTLRLMFEIDDEGVNDCRNLYLNIQTKEKIILAAEVIE